MKKNSIKIKFYLETFYLGPVMILAHQAQIHKGPNKKWKYARENLTLGDQK